VAVLEAELVEPLGQIVKEAELVEPLVEMWAADLLKVLVPVM